MILCHGFRTVVRGFSYRLVIIIRRYIQRVFDQWQDSTRDKILPPTASFPVVDREITNQFRINSG